MEPDLAYTVFRMCLILNSWIPTFSLCHNEVGMYVIAMMVWQLRRIFQNALLDKVMIRRL